MNAGYRNVLVATALLGSAQTGIGRRHLRSLRKSRHRRCANTDAHVFFSEGIMIRTSFAAAVSIAAMAWISVQQPALGQEETDQRLGTVHFATSCNETAQRRFDRGMRYQHSFWYRESKEIFEEVAKADPECGMAFWGIALTLLNNPHAAPPASNLPLGLAAIQKAKAVGAKPQRERDYIDALAVMYVDYDKIDHRSRVQAYLKAL